MGLNTGEVRTLMYELNKDQKWVIL
jgi:hypothetical protein